MSSGVDTDATLDAGGDSLPDVGRGAEVTVDVAPLQTARTVVDTERSPRAPAAAAETPVFVPVVASDEAAPGRVLAGRYRLSERLGAGAHGEVWTADDLVVGEPVALKWMRFAAGAMLARIRREITTLRLLRVPGVVRLVDDGVEGGRPFLVMERVQGAPFPGGAPRGGGARRRWGWDALADPTLALLEVLARVHAAGVIHRDLKPDNILVSAEGRPTVLDFGISLYGDPNSRLTDDRQILGTPLYLAPEQIFGPHVDARADLYAVGVMLYEALTGRVPHEANDVQSMLRARLMKSALPVQELAPEVPAPIAAVVDRLLAQRLEQRFRSAVEVLAVLRGQPVALRAGPALPRLGSRAPLDAVLEAARAGRPIDVVGPRGTGRTRCLEDAAEALAREGRRVAWLRPAQAPLASVQPVLGVPEEHASMRLTAIMEWAHERLRALLDAGAVVAADDAEQLDPSSAAVLARCRAGRGAVLRALVEPPAGARAEEIARLEPLDEASLRPLFAGPDRLFHLREDAAGALWQRTEGLPARIEAEATLWTRLGLARWDGAVLVVDRDALDRLHAGLPEATPAPIGADGAGGDPHLDELLRWLALAGHPLELTQIARMMGQPVWKIEAECEALVARGAARRLPGQRVEPRGQVDITWPSARRLEAHRAIARALRPGEEKRLFHLLAAEEAGEASIEAVEVARRHAREGHLGAAVAALTEGLRAMRESGAAEEHADEELPILTEWVKIAFADGTPRALDRALYELTRARGRGRPAEALEVLVRAAIAAPGASSSRALEEACALPPFEDPELERRRVWVRVVAATVQGSVPLVEAALADVSAWADASGEPMAVLALAEGRARLRYMEGRYDEAAALHAEAADREPWPTGRIAATLNCGSALLEAFQHPLAAERAALGRAVAARCRHPYWEGRAEWLLRAARYRMGEAATPDVELVEAIARLGVPALEALVCFTESAVAFRGGDPARAQELSERAARVWRSIVRPTAAMLTRSLALAAGAPAQPGEVAALVERACACAVPGIGIQTLGLLGPAFPEVRGGLREVVGKLVAGIPRACWHQRMDVLSVAEALEGALGEGADAVLTRY